MKYKSTRDGSQEYTFEQAICSGYAPDGGLFVPSSLPSITADKLKHWATLKFPELACDVLRMFISPEEINDGHLRRIMNDSFSSGVFDDENFVPVKQLGSVFVAELFHGPTFCFKDIGMRPVIQLLSYFATLRNKSTTLLVSTTGDTGPAAVRAVGDTGNPLLNILVHYPNGQISEFQRKQMTTVDSACVKVATFDGSGDDMDWPIKETLLMNRAGGEKECNIEGNVGRRSFCGINSYNIGRPMIQMVHFIWTYLRVVEKLGVSPGDQSCKIDMVVPTGAMGNITGGYMAKQMGVPIGMLCAGVNINDITHRAIQSGKFHKKKIEKTLSDAINIEVPYNFERLLFYLTGKDHSLVRDWMKQMDQTQALTLENFWVERLQKDFRSARITDDEMCDALRWANEEFDYVADPHTAVALGAAKKLGYSFTDEKPIQVVILATASPIKFQNVVTLTIGEVGWGKCAIPIRAKEINEKTEIEPFHYFWKEGATIEEVQSEWRRKMLEIVDHF